MHAVRHAGAPLYLLLVLLGAGLYLGSLPVCAVAALGLTALTHLYRGVPRLVWQDPQLVCSPCDGTVLRVTRHGAEQLELVLQRGSLDRRSCHAPVSGVLLPDPAQVLVRTVDGKVIAVVGAGLAPTAAAAGKEVRQGDRLGLLVGLRVAAPLHLWLPGRRCSVVVHAGERVAALQTLAVFGGV